MTSWPSWHHLQDGVVLGERHHGGNEITRSRRGQVAQGTGCPGSACRPLKLTSSPSSDRTRSSARTLQDEEVLGRNRSLPSAGSQPTIQLDFPYPLRLGSLVGRNDLNDVERNFACPALRTDRPLRAVKGRRARQSEDHLPRRCSRRSSPLSYPDDPTAASKAASSPPNRNTIKEQPTQRLPPEKRHPYHQHPCRGVQVLVTSSSTLPSRRSSRSPSSAARPSPTVRSDRLHSFGTSSPVDPPNHPITVGAVRFAARRPAAAATRQQSNIQERLFREAARNGHIKVKESESK